MGTPRSLAQNCFRAASALRASGTAAYSSTRWQVERIAASGTERRMAARAAGRSQGGKERDSRRASVARFWFRPRTMICLPVDVSIALVVLVVVVLAVTDQGAGPVGCIPYGSDLSGPGLNVGCEVH